MAYQGDKKNNFDTDDPIEEAGEILADVLDFSTSAIKSYQKGKKAIKKANKKQQTVSYVEPEQHSKPVHEGLTGKQIAGLILMVAGILLYFNAI